MSRVSTKGEYQAKSNATFPVKWTAPEGIHLLQQLIGAVLEGQPATPKSDIYSFGVTLWEIFTRGKGIVLLCQLLSPLAEEPFENLTNKEAWFKISQGERLERPVDCPDELWQLIDRCWQTDPANRPSISEVL
jgi:serine/threonine protein kinase